MSSEKPFWEGKTLMEIQNLDKRVKVTMENGDVFIGKLVRRSRDTDGICSLSMQLDAHRLQRNIAAWNRICNGSEKFTLYESLGGRR